jgi:uncharacterized metal-binding protein YceD (DUF177 family)
MDFHLLDLSPTLKENLIISAPQKVMWDQY